MPDFIHTQNSFANGEIAKEFFSRDAMNGLSKLENMDVLPAGGLRRRKGLRHIASLASAVRLIPFSVDEDENYVMAVTGGHLYVYDGATKVQDVIVPWAESDLSRLQCAQRFGTMIFVHPDYQPQILKKTGTRFELSKFQFARDDNMIIKSPYMKFDDAADVRIAITRHSYDNNWATFTASKSFWTAKNVGGHIWAIGKHWTVLEYISPTVIVAATNGGYTLPDSQVSDWSEEAFGDRRGWPCSISFHQDRLVFGGSREWPSGVWMSRVGIHNNFDVGTGLDDEAIFITLLSEQRQQICTVVSSDNLQILTSVGEWAISNKPLTPASVNIKQHTSVGSFTKRSLPPQKIDGGTVFIAGSGRDIRELALDEIGENYNANDLCALSKHLMSDPVDIAFNEQTGQLFVVMADGTLSVLNRNAVLGTSAWGVYKTAGEFKSVAVADGETYVCVVRGGAAALEKFDAQMFGDGDHEFLGTAMGLPMLASKNAPKNIRVRKISARVLDTKSLFLDGARVALPNEIYADGAAGFSGDVSINMLGSAVDVSAPLWTVSSGESLPATILSITISGTYAV